MLPRIKKRSQFLKVSQMGVKSHLRHFILLCMPRVEASDTPIEVGFTASKRVGNAVMRNRAKRRMRYLTDSYGKAIYSQIFIGLDSPSYHLVMIAKSGIIDAPMKDLQNDFAYGLRACLKQLKGAKP
ncbi:MAG: ribonuclease P protein component [Alphaproteobacteria bacterium]|nr:ribonuclease P protein component [Alphaproteobacteria bacterium]